MFHVAYVINFYQVFYMFHWYNAGVGSTCSYAEDAATQGRSPSFEASLKDREGRRGCCSSRLAASCKESQQPVVLAPVSTSLVSVCASGELSTLVNTPLCASNIFIHRMQKKSEVSSDRLKSDRPLSSTTFQTL